MPCSEVHRTPQPFVIIHSQCSKKDGWKAEYENRHLMTEEACTFGFWLSGRLEREDTFRMLVHFEYVVNKRRQTKSK